MELSTDLANEDHSVVPEALNDLLADSGLPRGCSSRDANDEGLFVARLRLLVHGPGGQVPERMDALRVCGSAVRAPATSAGVMLRGQVET